MGAITKPNSTRDHEWYDTPLQPGEITLGRESLQARTAPPGSPPRPVVPSYGECAVEVERLRWQAALKGWLQGVAAWNPESKALANAYARHAKANHVLAGE